MLFRFYVFLYELSHTTEVNDLISIVKSTYWLQFSLCYRSPYIFMKIYSMYSILTFSSNFDILILACVRKTLR